MAKYYYDKYSVLRRWSEPPISKTGERHREAYVREAKDAIWDETKNTYNLIGKGEGSGIGIQPGDQYVVLENNIFSRFAAITAPNGEGFIRTSYTERKLADSVERKTRGSLQQSGIVAESGTYPNDGAHTDGYWYVRGAIVNTAPTTPGAFTAPTGTLEIGDSKVVSWGPSTDAEGNLKNYVLEASLNNGAWSQIATPTVPSHTYTVPTATSVKFRVKAVDTGGLQSTYRESPVFTVTKPRLLINQIQVNPFLYIPSVDTGNLQLHFAISPLMSAPKSCV